MSAHRHFRTSRDRAPLTDLCLSASPRSLCVEIGCYLGEDTRIFAAHFDTVYALDPWAFKDFSELTIGCPRGGKSIEGITGPVVEAGFDENMQDISNVIKRKVYADDIVDEFEDASIDMLYIDSIHTYAPLLGHVRTWWPKIALGGLLAGHDYRPAFPEVQTVVDTLSTVAGLPLKVYADSSWALRTLE